MPKLWEKTVETHRTVVRHAILKSAWTLATKEGLSAVTMSRIANEAGIGRATLYRYFPDVEAILAAWHHRHVAAHLHRLTELKDGSGDAAARLRAVLEAYAEIVQERGKHGTDLVALLHRDDQAARAHEQLNGLIHDLLSEARAAHLVRDDVPPRELATYCLAALAAAGSVRTKVGLRRLVTLTLSGLARAS